MVKADKQKRSPVESQLCVWAMTGAEPKRVGTLDLWDQPAFHAEFRYAPEWLADPQRFSLDPINMPLSDQPYATNGRYEVMGVLFDAAPDAWGRTVMAFSDDSHPTDLPERSVLLKGHGNGVGAIGFSKPGTVLQQGPLFQPMESDLEQVFLASQGVLNHVVLDETLSQLLMSSWDMGGARPKVVLADKDGGQWIAKLPGKSDRFSCQRVEWANLEMARAIGIRVPDTKLVELSNGDAALLVKRFDREPDSEARRHYLSAVSLISPPADFDKRLMDAPEGAAYFSYRAVANVINRISSNSKADLAELFGRMVLNVLTHNTDDHLKNHGFLRDARGDKYRLSPLFDVMTQQTSDMKHSVHIGPQGRVGTLQNLREGGAQMRLSARYIELAIDAVQAVLAQRHTYYDRAGLPPEQEAMVEALLSSEIAPSAQLSADHAGRRNDADPSVGLER